MHLRFEDVSQNGRVMLDALPHGLGPAVWVKLLQASPVQALIARKGSSRSSPASSSRAERGRSRRGSRCNCRAAPAGAHGGRHLPGEPADPGHVAVGQRAPQPDLRTRRRPARASRSRSVACSRSTSSRGPSRRPRRARCCASSPRICRRCRPSATTFARRRRSVGPARGRGAARRGADPGSDPVAFGLDHTDGNQHVNSLVYPRLFAEAALRRLGARPQHGVARPEGGDRLPQAVLRGHAGEDPAAHVHPRRRARRARRVRAGLAGRPRQRGPRRARNLLHPHAVPGLSRREREAGAPSGRTGVAGRRRAQRRAR